MCGFPLSKLHRLVATGDGIQQGNHHGGGAGSQTALCDQFFCKGHIVLMQLLLSDLCITRIAISSLLLQAAVLLLKGFNLFFCHR